MRDMERRYLAIRLLRSGLTISEVHRQTGVPQSTIGYWKKNLATARPRQISQCHRCDDAALDRRAYSDLLGLYLGDGHIANAPGNKGVYRLEIACCDDWPGLMDMAAEAVATVMPALSVGRRQRIGCTMVGAYSKHWPCLFPQHGPGMKHTRKIALEPWQRKIVDEFTEEFVRGLIHSDGCRFTNRVRRPHKNGDRWYEYPRYNFTSASVDIRLLFTDALDRLGIAWKQMNERTVSVARREAVARLDEFVGPKH